MDAVDASTLRPRDDGMRMHRAYEHPRRTGHTLDRAGAGAQRTGEDDARTGLSRALRESSWVPVPGEGGHEQKQGRRAGMAPVTGARDAGRQTGEMMEE